MPSAIQNKQVHPVLNIFPLILISLCCVLNTYAHICMSVYVYAPPMHIYAYLRVSAISKDFGLKKYLDDSYAIFITSLLKCLSDLILMTSSILLGVLQATI